VTGASSGIGRGIAIACSRMGATIQLNGRNEKRLTETLAALEGTNHSIVTGDLSVQENNILNFLSFLFDGMPLTGVYGMKHRTKLLESKYDA
jgi:short-subunit dehydrogenase